MVLLLGFEESGFYLFWGFVWSLTKTRISTCTNMNITFWSRSSRIIILLPLLSLNTKQEYNMIILEALLYDAYPADHLYIELISWVN